MRRILVDSSFLYALYSPKDQSHQQALAVIETVEANLIIPDIILSEVTFLFNRAGGTPAVIAFLKKFVQTNIEPASVLVQDIDRASEIMLTYQSAHLDFVDCAIMAMSERLNITEVLTLDRRDFVIFRPKHCDYLTVTALDYRLCNVRHLTPFYRC